MTLPLMMSSVIFVLAIVELIKDFRRQADTQAASEASAESRTSTRVEWQRFGVALGWMIGFAIVIYLAGFIIATPLFLVFYLKRQGRGWLMVALVAVVTTAVIYSIFEIGLKAPLYRGLIQNIF